MMMPNNQIYINLNNAAISEIRKGSLASAFRMLSEACRGTAKSHAVDSKNYDADDGTTFTYSWVDCSKPLLPLFRADSRFREGSAEFLWLKFLTIQVPEDMDCSDHYYLCPCGYTWVLWYNLGIVSALLGTPTCEAGRKLLEQALKLFDRVSQRLHPKPCSKHFSLLLLAVMNNRVCVLKDLSRETDVLTGLVGIGLFCSQSWALLDTPDYDFFHWVAETHLMSNIAVAA